MQKFNGSLIRQFPSLVSGNAAAGIQVTVLDQTAAVATLYADNNIFGAQLDNPLTTDTLGFYSFYAPNGVYTLNFNAPGFPSLTIQLNDLQEVLAAAGRDLEVVFNDSAAFTVSGDDHTKMFICTNNNASPLATTEVTVGESLDANGDPANGAVIIFTQRFNPQLVFIPDTGITIISPNAPRAFGSGSTVALISITSTTWVLAGDTTLDPE